jgi:hypothetical protein
MTLLLGAQLLDPGVYDSDLKWIIRAMRIPHSLPPERWRLSVAPMMDIAAKSKKTKQNKDLRCPAFFM